MEWDAYKVICDRPDVFSRWMLAQTLELLAGDTELGAPLLRALASQPIAKPPGHKGGRATDMFELRLDEAQAAAVLARVRRAVAEGEETAGTRGRGLGGFLEAWAEYLDGLAAPHRAAESGASPPSQACSPAS